MCLVRNANEDIHGNHLKVNEYFCKTIKIKRELMN